MKMQKIGILICCLLLATTSIFATVRLPNVFADNMMFQRNQPIKIWGSADKGESVKVSFMGENAATKADKQGKWSVTLKPQSEGGPYELTVQGTENIIDIKNILIGELWFCSGQSNMEMTLNGWAKVDNHEKEVAEANYPLIRTFNVDKAINTMPQSDLEGKWLVCSPSTASDFSATAYFFARKLYQELNIPIGIVHSSWGGTDIEPWISGGAFNKLPATFKDRYADLGIKDFEKFMKINSENEKAYKKALENDKGFSENWHTNISLKDWKPITVPQSWSKNELNKVDGIVWFKHQFDLPEGVEGKYAEINLGAIDDNEITWINGQKVGATEGFNMPRKYTLPTDLLKAGKNSITIRVFDGAGDGGMQGKPEEMYLTIGDDKYPIAGEWVYKPSVTNLQYNYVSLGANSYPSLLYNAMVNPLLNFPFTGVIWYQGENNANDAYNYRTLFPTLISDWRAKWNNPTLSFYWVQLANYMAKDEVPIESAWAELREAQDMTLSMPHTGQAVITDVGDAGDIHPRNKQDVGLRLASIALNKDYGKGNEYYGPRYKSYEVKDNKIIISLDNVEQGVKIADKYGYIQGFAIAGADKKFVWAQAYLDGNKIVVHASSIKLPVAVRYSWSNNPDVNIFNHLNLPLAPFRTDQWNGITKK